MKVLRGFDLGQSLHRPVHAARGPAAVLLEGEALDGEVRHGAFHLAGEVRLEREALQVRGEMADGLHREDGRFHEFALDPDPVDEVLVVVVQRAQKAEIAEMQVGIPVVDMQVVQQDLPVADLHLAGEVAHVPAGLVRDGEMVRVAADDAVLDQDVGSVDVGLDFQVVPVDDVGGEGLAAPLVAAGGGDGLVHPEGEVLDIHLAGFQQVAEVLVGLVRVLLEAEDAGDVVQDGLVSRAGLEDQVQLAVLQPEAAHGDALLVEEALQGEAGGQAADAGQRVLAGEFPAVIGMAVGEDDVLEGDGVERADGDVADADVAVDVFGELVDGLPGEGGLHRRRLDGHDERQQQDHECRQNPCRYAKALLHNLQR